MARLYEEIYIVDPVLIVALGIEAARILAKSPLKYTTTRGTTLPIKVPGAWSVPDLTQSKKTWERKHGNQIFRPTKQNYVEYLMVTTLKPNYVLQHYADESHGNPKQEFLQDMTLAANIFFRYVREAYGADTPQHIQTPDIDLEN
jgi:uracil-DNA glycosylase